MILSVLHTQEKFKAIAVTPHMPKVKKKKRKQAGPLKINQKKMKQQPKTIPPNPRLQIKCEFMVVFRHKNLEGKQMTCLQ